MKENNDQNSEPLLNSLNTNLENLKITVNEYNKNLGEFNSSVLKPLVTKSYSITYLKNQIEKQQSNLKKIFEKEIKKLEEKNTSEIIKLRDEYIKENSGNMHDKCFKFGKKRILLIIVSLFHFIYMLGIHGILFALLREIKREIYFRIKEKYPKFDTKTFDDYYSTSSMNDSSKINFSYLTAFLSDILIAKTSISIVYVFSVNLNIIIILLLFIKRFLSIEELENEKHYSGGELAVFIIIYCIIYIIASLISLYPFSISQKIGKNNHWINIFIMGSLTLAVFSKNLLLTWKFYNNNKWLHIVIMFFSGLFLIIYLNYYKKELNSFYIDENFINEISDKENKIKENNINENTEIEKEIKEKNKEKIKEKIPADYILGYLIIKNDFTTIIITIKGFWGYICSILKNAKIWYIIFINLCSRAQKLKFKTEYKKAYKENTYLLSINFLFSYFIYVGVIIIIKYLEVGKKKEKNDENERNNINSIESNKPKTKNDNEIQEVKADDVINNLDLSDKNKIKEKQNNNKKENSPINIINDKKNLIINIDKNNKIHINSTNDIVNISDDKNVIFICKNNDIIIEQKKNLNLNVKNLVNIDKQNNVTINKIQRLQDENNLNNNDNIIKFDENNNLIIGKNTNSNIEINNKNNTIKIDNKNNINIYKIENEDKNLNKDNKNKNICNNQEKKSIKKYLCEKKNINIDNNNNEIIKIDNRNNIDINKIKNSSIEINYDNNIVNIDNKNSISLNKKNNEIIKEKNGKIKNSNKKNNDIMVYYDNTNNIQVNKIKDTFLKIITDNNCFNFDNDNQFNINNNSEKNEKNKNNIFNYKNSKENYNKNNNLIHIEDMNNINNEKNEDLEDSFGKINKEDTSEINTNENKKSKSNELIQNKDEEINDEFPLISIYNGKNLININKKFMTNDSKIKFNIINEKESNILSNDETSINDNDNQNNEENKSYNDNSENKYSEADKNIDLDNENYYINIDKSKNILIIKEITEPSNPYFREKVIILFIMSENLLMAIFSLICFFDLNKLLNEVLFYISIFLSGSFNFILYDYYSFSTSQSEYLTLSGIISVSQLIFRGLEFFDSYFSLENNLWYFIQMLISLLGSILCICYYLYIIYS